MAVAVQCMYMRGAIFELTKKHGATTKRYDSVQQLFPTIKENVPLHRFNVIAARLVATMKRRWNGKLGRSEFLQRFSAERWKKLNNHQKKNPLKNVLHRMYHSREMACRFPSENPAVEVTVEGGKESRCESCNQSQGRSCYCSS